MDKQPAAGLLPLPEALTLAERLLNRGEKNAAHDIIQQILRQHPYESNATSLLARIQFISGNISTAGECFKKAVELNPDNVNFHLQLLEYYFRCRQFNEMVKHIASILNKFPNDKAIFNYAGIAQRELGNLQLAADNFARAINLDRKFAAPYYNQAIVFQLSGQLDEAIPLLYKSMELNPTDKYSYLTMVEILILQDKLDLALKMAAKANELAPEDPLVIATYMYVARHACEWDKVKQLTEPLNKAIDTAIKNNTYSPETPFLNITRVNDKAMNLAVAKSAIDFYYAPKVAAYQRNYQFSTEKKKKINIGYFCCDFRDHAISHLLAGLFEYHDHKNFNVIALSHGPVLPEDYYYQLIKKTSDKFIQFTDESFAKIADIIHENEIDILIDVNGFTNGAKLEVMALKPAPIQIQYIGFTGSMGAKFYDYVICDKIVTPPEDEKFYLEKFLYMPNSYLVTDNQQAVAKSIPSRKEVGLPDDAIVLASFNNSFKLEQDCFEIWLDILAHQPKVVLWIYEANDYIRNKLTAFAQQYNNTQDRIVYAPRLPKVEHLARMQLADLVLDTFTCNGHTTTVDALWVDVPVVTLQGNHFVSRVSASVLNALDLSELVTQSKEDYRSLIEYYCKNPDKLAKLKQQIAKAKKKEPLFDTKLYAKDLEKVLTKAYKNFINGNPPEIIN